TSVLDFTRLSSGKVSLNVERFALAPLLTEIQALQSARLRSPDVALTVAVDPEVAEVETDRVKLQEIVRNLLDNAVKFTEAGRIPSPAPGPPASPPRRPPTPLRARPPRSTRRRAIPPPSADARPPCARPTAAHAATAPGRPDRARSASGADADASRLGTLPRP